MKKINLTIATSDYDHFRDFRTGVVQAEGIEPIWLQHEIHEIFSRFAAKREWDVGEMSFAKFTAQFSEETTTDVIALPVFASRVFRLSSLYVNPSKGIKTAADLKGKRVGLPEDRARRARCHHDGKHSPALSAPRPQHQTPEG